MESLFWFCACFVMYVYVGYPLLIKLIAMRKNEVNKDVDYLPSVSILIAAYNEEKDIENTIKNKLALDYPDDRFEILVVSDESDDRTDEIVLKLAKDSTKPIRLIRQSPRAGKTAGLNILAPEASGEVLVFSDANSLYASNTLRKLVSNFADPSVGYVTGKMVYVTGDGSLVGDGCSSYMKYENWLREQETKVGSVVGVDGGVDAIRASLFEKLRSDQLPDFIQPLKVTEKGYRVVYEQEAMLKEEALDDSRREYIMRVRVSLRALWALHDMRGLFNPLKHGVFALQIISHKLLRYLVFLPLALCFLANIALFTESFFYLITLLFQVAFYALAFLGKLRVRHNQTLVFLALPYYFTLLNIACAHATLRYLKGEKQVIWKPRLG